jgi:hypothetical protein
MPVPARGPAHPARETTPHVRSVRQPAPRSASGCAPSYPCTPGPSGPSDPAASARPHAPRTTAEELEKDAEELFKQFAPTPPSRGGQRPTESLRTVPLNTNGEADRTDMNEWMRQQAASNKS